MAEKIDDLGSTESDEVVKDHPTDEGAKDTPTDEGVPDATGVKDVTPEDGDVFPRDYVEKLRDENAKYRQRASDRDDLAKRLHEALVTATGRLQDPSDLPFDEDHIVDPAKMVAAIDELLAVKPHLASRRPAGDIGQGVSVGSDTFSLMGVLNQNAR